MSRSRKKVAGWVDRNPYAKNLANKRLRRITIQLNIELENMNDEMPSFGKYKKYSESWDICDWRSVYFCELTLIKKFSDWYEQRSSWKKQTLSKDQFVSKMLRTTRSK